MLHRSKRHGTVIIGIISAGFFFWIAGLFAFLQSIPKQIEDTTTLTNTIVVLTGGSLRLETGLELLRKGNARKLFVSGVHRGVDVKQLLRLARQSPMEANCCIFLGHEADDTAGNAEETAVWMNKHGYRSMRLVTAAYHMPRSVIEFRNAMPHATILLHPVFPEQVKLDKWWMWPGTAGLILGEYSKYLIARIRHILTQSAG
jgi:uncharacterized SAM-binding protein YcdF (DUF218 family)